MIEHLNGIHETVSFKDNTTIKLYDNSKYEEYPPHWHMPLEIIMPTEGDYDVMCSGYNFHLRTFDILVLCPGVVHSIPAHEGRRIIFQSDFSTLQQFKSLESILSIFSPALCITPEDYSLIHDKVKNLLLSILEEYTEENLLVDASIHSMLLQIFVLIGRNHTQNLEHYESGYSKQKEFTEKFLFICNYINDHCTEDLSLDDVAELAGFSKYHFSRLFKQFTNVSFYKYLNQKRIATAERLLIDPKLTVTDVALRSGFSSMSTFIRMFHIVKDCTPKEFRNMYTC
ncbi:MAG TPA: AraC family transcriptional regulator [Lachnospiraceae bacterium]|nr:AraC family transcriptional regulator [Lachnospiraceae bacterium]